MTVKHGSRKRLATELSQKTADVQAALGIEDAKGSSKPGSGGPLTRALKNLPCLCFLFQECP